MASLMFICFAAVLSGVASSEGGETCENESKACQLLQADKAVRTQTESVLEAADNLTATDSIVCDVGCAFLHLSSFHGHDKKWGPHEDEYAWKNINGVWYAWFFGSDTDGTEYLGNHACCQHPFSPRCGARAAAEEIKDSWGNCRFTYCIGHSRGTWIAQEYAALGCCEYAILLAPPMNADAIPGAHDKSKVYTFANALDPVFNLRCGGGDVLRRHETLAYHAKLNGNGEKDEKGDCDEWNHNAWCITRQMRYHATCSC